MMPNEIERKYLVYEDKLPDLTKLTKHKIVQGYLAISDDNTVCRVRTSDTTPRDKWKNLVSPYTTSTLTIKGKNNGITRKELEYDLPDEDVVEMLDLCMGVVEKTRYEYSYLGLLFEIDVFEGHNDGLIVCEVELENENDEIDLPDFISVEVSGDKEYYNSNLMKVDDDEIY